jgi:opine dehydrogenase
MASNGDLQKMHHREGKPTFAVLGAGHGGLAMAGHLSIMGFDVKLFARTEERLWGVKAMGGIEMDGEVEGFAKIPVVTNHMDEALDGVEIIMVVVQATAHGEIARLCAPHLVDGQMVVLNPGHTFGALEFRHVLAAEGCHADVVVAETQSFIYASRAIGPGNAQIMSIENSIPVATLPAGKIQHLLPRLRIAFPQFVAGENIFKTGFEDVMAFFRPVICILNAGWIEDDAEFQFYLEGVTSSVATVLEQVDAERVQVARRLGIRPISAKTWLHRFYGASGSRLFGIVRANPSFRGIMAPTHLRVRYIAEDVPSTLIPTASVGAMFGVPTPTIESVIQVACALNEHDYWAEGRTVERLGLPGISLRDLRQIVLGEEKARVAVGEQ